MPPVKSSKRGPRSIVEIEQRQDEMLARIDELSRQLEAALAAAEREVRGAEIPLRAAAA